MKFEHFAINVPDAAAHAKWYVEHVGFTVARAKTDAPFTHFLADDTGRVVLEVYSNPAAPYPEYGSQHPLVFHFAVVSADARRDAERLMQAGATLANTDALPDGSLLLMLRDPWGVPLQICQRAAPMP